MADEATQTHCYHHCLPYLGILCAWTTMQMLRGSCWPPLRQTGEDNWVVPTSYGSAPFNRIWNITILRSLKQQIWLRTTLCGGWCRRMALRNRELHARNDDDPPTPIWWVCVLLTHLFLFTNVQWFIPGVQLIWYNECNGWFATPLSTDVPEIQLHQIKSWNNKR